MNYNDHIQTNKKNDSSHGDAMSSDEKKKIIYRKNTINEVNSTNNILSSHRRRRCGQSALELYECSQIRPLLSSSSSSASSSFTSSPNLLDSPPPSPLLYLPRLPPSSAFSTASVITSSVPLLDVFLGGGVFPFHGRSRRGGEALAQFSVARENLSSPIGIGGGIYELVGSPGSGKTQLCLQWSLNVQLPPHLGGLSRHAIFIDSEGSATIERLRQIADGVHKRLNNISSIANDNKQRKKENTLNITFNTIPNIATTSSAAITTTTYPNVNARNELKQNDDELKSSKPTSLPSQTNTYNDDDEKNHEGKDEERRKCKKRLRSPFSSPCRNRSWDAATSSEDVSQRIFKNNNNNGNYNNDVRIHPDDANSNSASKLLEGVKVFRIFDQYELWQIVQALPSLITSSPPSSSLSTTPPHVSSSSSSSTSVGLILLDSLCFPHRLMTSNSFAHRSSHLLRLAAFLRKLAADFHLAIVVTNHLTTQFNSTSSFSPPPSFPFFSSSSSLTHHSTNDDHNEMRRKYTTEDEEENYNSETTLRETEASSFSSTHLLPALGNSWQSIPSVRLQLSWVEGRGGVKVRSIQILKTSAFSAARGRIVKFRIEDEGIKGEEEEEAFWGMRKKKDLVGSARCVVSTVQKIQHP